jgi:hypothetical protein
VNHKDEKDAKDTKEGERIPAKLKVVVSDFIRLDDEGGKCWATINGERTDQQLLDFAADLAECWNSAAPKKRPEPEPKAETHKYK